jgi:hypothetical protein
MILAIVCSSVLFGCETTPERKEIDRLCRLQGHETDMRCAPRPRQKTRKEMEEDHIEVCEIRGRYEQCYWVRRSGH